MQGQGLEQLSKRTYGNLLSVVKDKQLVDVQWKETDLFSLTFDILYFAELLTL